MPRRLAPIVVHGLFLLSPIATVAEERADIELVLTGDRGVQRIPLAIRAGDGPLAESWDRAVAVLLRHFDRDGDGSLNREEAARLPSPLGLCQVAWGIFRFDGPAPPWDRLDADGDGRVVAAELSACYRAEGAGPVLVAIGQPPFTEGLNAAIISRLDGDGDGVLTFAELREAEARLFPFDRNGDGLIAAEELAPTISYPGSRATLPPNGLDIPLAVHPVPEATGTPAWPAAIGGAPAPWRSADAGGVTFHLRTDDGAAGADLLAHRKQSTTLFAASDDDGDRRIAGPELDDPARAILVLTRDWADRDGDGALTEAELGNWFDLLDALVRARALVAVLDHGRGLFEAIDGDHDGAIGAREARTAAERLGRAGAIVDGRLVLDRLPRVFIACVSPGQPLRALGPRPPSGIDWFDGMDRNRDGDLSPAEWLHELAAFRELDADRDGLISPQEAAMSRKRSIVGP